MPAKLSPERLADIKAIAAKGTRFVWVAHLDALLAHVEALEWERDEHRNHAKDLRDYFGGLVDERDALKAEVERLLESRDFWVRECKAAEEAWEAENAALRARLEAAPHGIGCGWWAPKPGPCDCWKRAATPGEGRGE